MERDVFLEHFLPGSNPAMEKLRETIVLLNRRYKNPPHMGRSLLLLGETGVGKNHVARVIAGHLYWLRDPDLWAPPGSRQKTRTLLEVTAEHFAELPLPTVPSELVESELFGHVRGAFTGAVVDKEGYFGDAHIEDLLLDEIGDAPPALQAKLLQILNDGSYKRLGALPSEPSFTEARILLATNRDLANLVRSGDFRADLYWRIQHLVIRIPPLRKQRDRIAVLAESIVAEILRESGAPPASLDSANMAWQRSRTRKVALALGLRGGQIFSSGHSEGIPGRKPRLECRNYFDQSVCPRAHACGPRNQKTAWFFRRRLFQRLRARRPAQSLRPEERVKP